MEVEQHASSLPVIGAAAKDQQHVPLDIGRFVFLPGRKVYCFIIKSKRTPGALYRMAELAEKTGATILYGIYSIPRSNGKSAGTSTFIDFTDATAQPEEIAEKIRQLDYVESVKVALPNEKGFVADTFSFPLKVDDERAIIIRKSIYKSFLVDIRERFGSAGSVFLYYVGYDLGLKAIDNHTMFATSFDAATIIKIAKTITMNMGWAICEPVELDMKNKTAVVRLYESFECELQKNQGSNKPFSQFFRGAIAGAFTKIFNKPVTIEEIKCIAKGDSYCEFHIQ